MQPLFVWVMEYQQQHCFCQVTSWPTLGIKNTRLPRVDTLPSASVSLRPEAVWLSSFRSKMAWLGRQPLQLPDILPGLLFLPPEENSRSFRSPRPCHGSSPLPNPPRCCPCYFAHQLMWTSWTSADLKGRTKNCLSCIVGGKGLFLCSQHRQDWVPRDLALKRVGCMLGRD